MSHRNNRKTLLGLFVRALFPRLLFLLHGIMCVHITVKQENEGKYWYLTICLGLLFLEGIFNVIVRHGKEFHWYAFYFFHFFFINCKTLVCVTEQHCLSIFYTLCASLCFFDTQNSELWSVRKPLLFGYTEF